MDYGGKRASPADMENENIFCSLPSSSNRNVRLRVLEERRDERLVHDKLVSFLPGFDLPVEYVNSCGLSLDQHLRVTSYVDKVKEPLAETGCTLIVENEALYIYSSYGVLYRLTRIGGPGDGIIETIKDFVDSIGATNVLQIFSHDTVLIFDPQNSLSRRYPWMNLGLSPAHVIMLLVRDISGIKSFVDALIITRGASTEKDNSWTLLRVDEDKYSRDFGANPPIAIDDLAMTLEAFWKMKSLLKFIGEGQKAVLRDADISNDDKSYADHMLCCEKFWDQTKEWVSVFQSILEAFFLTSKKCPTSGYLHQIMEKSRVTIMKCCHIERDSMDRLLYLFDNFQSEVMHPMYAAAAFLNPAFLYCRNFKEDGELKRGIEFVLNYLVEAVDKEAFLKEFKLYHSKDPSIFTLIAKPMLESSNPVMWWKDCGSCVPTLQKYAIRILSQPCNRFCCYDLHINWEFVQNYRGDESMSMMQKFITLEAEMLSPIDVSNVGLPEWLSEYHARDRLSIDNDDIFLGLLRDVTKIKCPACQTIVIPNEDPTVED